LILFEVSLLFLELTTLRAPPHALETTDLLYIFLKTLPVMERAFTFYTTRQEESSLEEM